MARHVVVFFGIIISLIIVGLYGFRTYTKSFSPEGESSIETTAGLKIDIHYSRPYQKNRKLFGYKDGLIHFGEIWRTGANEATEIIINKDVEIFGQTLPAGNYTLFSIPNEITWTVIFNKVLNQWGAFNYNEADDILRVNVPSFVNSQNIDLFTIELKEKEKGAEMRLLWGNTLVSIPMNIK